MSTSTEASSSRSSPARWSRSHGTPVNCTAWVTSWNTTHASSSASSASKARAASRRLGATNSSRGGRSGSSSASSYWPSTRRPMKPTSPPTSTPMSAPPRSAAGPRPGARAPGRASPILSRFARAQPAVDGLGRRKRHGGLQLVYATTRSRRRRQRGEVRAPASGGAGAVAAGDGLGDAPARLQSTIRRRAAWPARRAPGRCARRRRASAARGPAARRAGRPAVNATRPPLSRTISCAAGGVHRAALPQGRHAVDAGRGDLAQRDRDRAMARRRRSAPSASPDATSQRGSADSIATSSSRPSRLRRSGGGRSGSSSSNAPPPSRPPLLARARVVHVAEHHVGHRRAVGDRDRERVVGQPPLGVQRPVDRVDDHEHVRRSRSPPRRAPRTPR